MAKDTDINHR